MDLDRVLMSAISALVNGEPLEDVIGELRAGTRDGEAMPEGGRLYYDMAVDLLVEGDVDEAEKCLWAARAENLREVIG